MIDADAIRQRWDAIGSKLDERGQRLFAAVEVRTAGWGGLAIVSKITGLARSTINRGKNDLDAEPLPKGQVRRAGGGRRALSENDPGLIAALKRLVEPATLGDPMRPPDLGVEKHGETGCGADGDGTSDQCRYGAQGVGETRVLAPVQSQGGRRLEASRPKCPVRTYQREGHCSAGPTTASHLRRYEEEGADRQLQECRNRLPSERQSAACERARLRGQETRQGRAVWRIRCDRQRRLRQRRDHERYCRVRRAFDPLLARTQGTTALSACTRIDDHGRLRRLEWYACAALESRAAKACRRDWARDPCPPLSAGHIEVEQDRAPTVLSHH